MVYDDDLVKQYVKTIVRSISEREIDLLCLKEELIVLLEHLSSSIGRTDENCRAVDYFFTKNDVWLEVELPEDFHDLLADMSGALHDTVLHPDIAINFDSTPEQLLERAKKLNTEKV